MSEAINRVTTLLDKKIKPITRLVGVFVAIYILFLIVYLVIYGLVTFGDVGGGLPGILNIMNPVKAVMDAVLPTCLAILVVLLMGGFKNALKPE
jgi:hypothetical protein